MAMYMPGRKQAQIEAFTACLPAHRGPYLEWCAGKGHLGRLVSLHRQAEVLSLELQAPLCEEGACWLLAMVPGWHLSVPMPSPMRPPS